MISIYGFTLNSYCLKVNKILNVTNFYFEKLVTHLVALTETPVVSNSITLVLGSSVVPGGAPAGPLISGLRLALVM